MDFRCLLLAAGCFHLAAYSYAAAGRKLFDFRLVVGQLRIGDDLNIGQTRAIVQLEKAEAAFRIAPRANPALQRRLSANCRWLSGVDNGKLVHKRVTVPSQSIPP